ncbi:unnamed protein product [Lepeophtheirus salmonis]|uniref:(salmon louse) hypothetical protein n=1 Tax=Lepeophtheirus salmonis TaxID=72036 RepID=A0A0K2T8Y3_LEPSM|nr:uncharacterized protein LOC121127929 [Lepeophtheirus salmonis]CAB4058172.1 unnamed protein product [Lepeophtheirus salmonis]CAF2828212.1 unnamed protein product [Lepeophtheirus salmonis]
MKQFTVSALFLTATVISSVYGFDPVTLTVGTTAYVLTAAQTTLGVAALAGLAIAKEKLIISALSNRGKRDVSAVQEAKNVDLNAFFWAVGQADVSDCGKLLVCEVMATPTSELKREEELIANLFDNEGKFTADSATNEYQFAAYVGTLQQPQLCKERYATCTVPSKELLKVVEAHTGAQV